MHRRVVSGWTFFFFGTWNLDTTGFPCFRDGISVMVRFRSSSSQAGHRRRDLPLLIGFCNGCWLHSGLDLPYRVSFAVSTVIGAFRRTKQRSVTGQRRAWKRGCIPEGKHHKSGEYNPTKNGSSQSCSVRYVDKACQLQTLDSPKHSSQILPSQKIDAAIEQTRFFLLISRFGD